MFSYRALLPLGLLLLSGCSTTSSDTLATLRYAVQGPADVTVTADHVATLPYASAYVRVGDNPQAVVVLAFADPDGSLHWLSADHKLFVTKAGRLVKTVGWDNDLYALTASMADPLTRLDPTTLARLTTPSLVASDTWHYTAEWTRHYLSGYALSARWLSAQPTELVILDRIHAVVLMEEEVVVEHSQARWHNRYWVDRDSGQLVKSQQQLGPDLPVIEMTILKPYSS